MYILKEGVLSKTAVLLKIVSLREISVMLSQYTANAQMKCMNLLCTQLTIIAFMQIYSV